MQEISFDDIWYSWIPSNLGILNFNYIADNNNLTQVFGNGNISISSTSSQKIIHLSETNLSDLNCIIKKISNISEAQSTAEIILDREVLTNQYTQKPQTKLIKGSCKINFSNILTILSSFKIELNGKITIQDIKLHYQENQINSIKLTDTLKKTIVNAIYTLVKKVVHGDNHHYQKIDTMIDVYTDFNPKQIITDLAFQIKRLEKFVKLGQTESISAIYNVDKEHAYLVAQGFQSYIQTLDNLFKDYKLQEDENTDKLNYISLENIKNVILSLPSNTQRAKINRESKRNATIFFISLLALFSTLNIFYGTLIPNAFKESNFFVEHLISRDTSIFIFFVLIFMIPIFNYHIKNYFLTKIRFMMKNQKSVYTLLELFVLMQHTQYLSKELQEMYSNEILTFQKYKYKIYSWILSFPLSFFILSLGIYLDNNYYIFISLSFLSIAILLFLQKKKKC